MKVVSSKEMASLESKSYEQGCSEEIFMQNAAIGVANIVKEFVIEKKLKKSALILAGKGNNAGDAYEAGSYLLDEGFKVIACSGSGDEGESPLCRKQKRLFTLKGGELFDAKKLLNLSWDGIIIDGIFGTGLKSAPKDPYGEMIRWANKTKAPIIAVDIPSGLSGDTGEVFGDAISARITVALGLPKIGFFLQEGWNLIGELKYVDFGLPQSIIDGFQTPFRIYEKEKGLEALPPIKRNRHKYEAGEVICLAGSPGMPGSANLATLAVLRSGAGMVKLYHPKGMESELSSSAYEVIKIPYENSEQIIQSANDANAFLVGPGLGRMDSCCQLLKEVFSKIEVPCVIDADALFFYAKKAFEVPKDSILTPHLGEMNRILGIKTHIVTLDYLKRCLEFSKEKEIILVLKGGPSFIFSPEGLVWINLTGDPGMATAGSGDVLTGIIAGLLAQKMKPLDAACAGVCIHGWSGEIASKIMSPYCMIASDIIHYLPKVFRVSP